jgi:hypothetical protein
LPSPCRATRRRFLRATGHSLDNEHPEYVAQQIAEFLR